MSELFCSQNGTARVLTRSRALACLLFMVSLACSPEPSGGEQGAGSTPGEELPGGSTTNTLLFGENALTRHVENITDENEQFFFSGNGFFNQAWVMAPASTEARDGLGPLFNARSCAACHAKDGRGHPPLEVGDELLSILFRLSVGLDDQEMPVGDPVYGGQLQPFSVGDVPAEGTVLIAYSEQESTYPDGTKFSLRSPTYQLSDLAYGEAAQAVVVSPRVAPAMHGLGLLEAIPALRLAGLADEDDADGDGISGRLRMVPEIGEEGLSIGRFGWKAEQPSVRQQSAGAFVGDMGLTTELFPSGECEEGQVLCFEQPSGAEAGAAEVSPEILDRVERYGQLVAVPARSSADAPEILSGKQLFIKSGCSACHTPSHVTGEHELSELANQTIFPYTDLLLHDMGVALADGTGATRVDREWRTPPLWGLRFYPVVNGHDLLLHDGRARGIEEAVLWHGGEANASKEKFMDFGVAERQLLIEFVRSL
jgi:CxxC motif-containing protein (DUF1111 family)